MFGALLAYPLIFAIGYLLLVLAKKKSSGFETIFLSFMLGTSNVIFVLMIFGIVGRLDFGVFALLIEFSALFFLVWRRSGSLIKLNLPNLVFESNWSDVAFILIIFIGLGIRFALIESSLPNVSWDALKFYMPWAKQLYQFNLIPSFDYTFNAGEPIGHSISFVLMGYLLYFLNGGVNEILLYTISPVCSLVTTLMVYVFVRKLFNNRRLGYVAGAIYVLVPLNILVGSIPYVDAMLSLYVLAFFFYIDSPYVAAVAASLAMLTKYSGFVLPLLLISYLFYKRKIRLLLPTVLIFVLLTVPWYLRNFLLFNNPLTFMAFSVKTFETPPEAFDILVRHGSQMSIFDPLVNVLDFFSTNDLLAVVSRLIVLLYVAYAILRKKTLAFYMVSFLTFFFVFWFSGERDVRYLIPFYPLCLFAFMDMMHRVNRKVKNIWYRALLGILIGLFSITFFAGSAILYLSNTYILISLAVVGFVIPLIIWRMRHGIVWKRVIPMRYLLGGSLVSLVVFSFVGQPYTPLVVVKEQLPNWQSGIIELIENIRLLPDRNQHYFLMVEDPGIRYYADIKSYELTDPYGNIRLNDLFDKPNIQSVFFGLDSRRLETQRMSVLQEESEYENVDNVEAIIDQVTLRFPDLEVGEYLLMVNYKGSGVIQDRGSLPASNETWNTFENKFMVEGSSLTVTFSKTSWLWLRFVLLIPSKIYDDNYIDWLRNQLNTYDIRYIILSIALSNVWVYRYYSIFAFMHLPGSMALFEKVYSSDYWIMYKIE